MSRLHIVLTIKTGIAVTVCVMAQAMGAEPLSKGILSAPSPVQKDTPKPDNATAADTRPVIRMEFVPRYLENGQELRWEVIEGETKAIRVKLSKPSRQPVKVWYGLAGIGGALPGIHFDGERDRILRPEDRRIVFRPGEKEKIILVTTFDDQEGETSVVGGVAVFLVDAVNATIGDNRIDFYIFDDDRQPEIVPSPSNACEGEKHGFAVMLNRRYREPVSIQYETKEGTAEANRHFSPASGKVVFPPWVTRIDVPVETIYTGLKPGETRQFRMVYRNPVNARLKDAEAIGTIWHNPDRGKDSSQR